MIKKFRKKPVVIEAVKYDGTENSVIDILELQGSGVRRLRIDGGDVLVNTPEGIMRAKKGDWIIKEPFPTDARTFYPCKPDIFEKTYEEILCPVLQKKTDRERYDGIVSQTNFSDDGRRYKTNGHLNPKVTLKTESYDRIKNIYPE